MGSVLQDWVMELPLREQGVLLTGVRGCDLTPKEWDENGVVINTPARQLTAFLRFCFMNPADPREVDIPGAFFQSTISYPFKPGALGHYPLHWYTHVMHCFQVVGVRHPNFIIQSMATQIYDAMVDNLHLYTEPAGRMIERLSEDRIASGKVVQ